MKTAFISILCVALIPALLIGIFVAVNWGAGALRCGAASQLGAAAVGLRGRRWHEGAPA